MSRHYQVIAQHMTKRSESRKIGKPFTYSAFTLAELIVVITVLAILATIGFLTLSGYSQDAKDSATKANVRSVSTAISSESAVSGYSPRYYVVHDTGAALSGAVAYVDSNPTVLTGGDWNQAGTNYSAGNPDYAKLKLNPDKFKTAKVRMAADEAVAAYDAKYLTVGAADFSTKANGKARLSSYFQVVGKSPVTNAVTVSGNYPVGLSGSVTGLVRNPALGSTGAFVDGSVGTNGTTVSIPASCNAILALNPLAPSGNYDIDPDGTSGPIATFTAYCDMVTDGGGWTKVAGSSTAVDLTSASAIGTIASSAYKFDNATIEAVRANSTWWLFAGNVTTGAKMKVKTSLSAYASLNGLNYATTYGCGSPVDGVNQIILGTAPSPYCWAYPTIGTNFYDFKTNPSGGNGGGVHIYLK